MALLPSFPGFGSFATLQLGDHLCLPVGSDAERLGGTVELTELGLRRGGKVIVFTASEEPDELAAHLTGRLPPAAAALALGQLQVLPCHDHYLVGGVFNPDRTVAEYFGQITLAEEQGYRGLWVAVDMTWSLSGLPGTGSLVDFEATANPGFADHRIAAVCIYDRTRFCPALLERACRAHPLTPGQAPLRFTRTTDPPGLTLSGEADLTNHGALTALLTALHTEPGHVTIDATGLRFADLRAADLLSGVSLARHQGTTTITGSLVVNRLLELTGDTRPAVGRRPHV
ncbi:MAG: MEDS domain-containing protein [Pseudonocardiaceae bacterium]